MMDEPQTRALLATMEVMGKVMAQLVSSGHLPADYVSAAARKAASRLEPTSEGLFLEDLAEQWRATADLMEQLTAS